MNKSGVDRRVTPRSRSKLKGGLDPGTGWPTGPAKVEIPTAGYTRRGPPEGSVDAGSTPAASTTCSRRRLTAASESPPADRPENLRRRRKSARRARLSGLSAGGGTRSACGGQPSRCRLPESKAAGALAMLQEHALFVQHIGEVEPVAGDGFSNPNRYLASEHRTRETEGVKLPAFTAGVNADR